MSEVSASMSSYGVVVLDLKQVMRINLISGILSADVTGFGSQHDCLLLSGKFFQRLVISKNYDTFEITRYTRCENLRDITDRKDRIEGIYTCDSHDCVRFYEKVRSMADDSAEFLPYYGVVELELKQVITIDLNSEIVSVVSLCPNVQYDCIIQSGKTFQRFLISKLNDVFQIIRFSACIKPGDILEHNDHHEGSFICDTKECSQFFEKVESMA
jgi:CxxC motif-containing protein